MELFVEKDTDLMRCTLAAIGLAALFDKLPPAGSGSDVRLRDLGSTYVIEIPFDADKALDYLQSYHGSKLPPLLPAIRKAFSAGEQKALEADPLSKVQFKYVPLGFPSDQIIEYDAQKELAAAARRTKKGDRQEGESYGPAPDYPVWAHLCSYFGRGSAMRTVYPSILHTWHAHVGEQAKALLDLLIRGYGEFPNDLEAMRDEWSSTIFPELNYSDYSISADVTASSLVSPSTVKGDSTLSAALKPDPDTPTRFWLEMYLVFAGYMAVGMPYNLSKDVMLYYPLPHDISFGWLQREMDTYRRSDRARDLYRFSNAMMRPKLDALAHIAFYQSVVEHFRQNTANDVDLWDSGLNQFSGLVGYYYRKNGGTQIPFDETRFAMPRWLPHAVNDQQLKAVEYLLDQHYQIIDRIRGKIRGQPPKYSLTADELRILNAYRQFVIHGEVDAWIDFTIHYNHYRFVNAGEFSFPDLSIVLFQETLMNMDSHKSYQEVFDNPGFQAISRAIYECTAGLQYRTSRKKPPEQSAFKIRYGLGDDLQRNAHNADLFVEALSDFVFDFQRESGNVMVSTGERRFTNIEPYHIQQIAGLIPKFGSGVVAKLLVAVGYCTHYPPKADGSA